jgi:ABC-type phosphate transport system substrate-binding protein
MGFTVLMRRILVPALALALAAAVAACTGSGSSSGSSAPVSSVPASAPPTATNTAAAVAQITANWEKAFNGSTPLSRRVTLVQNGSIFTAVISDSRKWPSGLGSSVMGVRLDSATSATVTYSIGVDGFGEPALTGLTGTAVYQDGVWKVGDASLCAVLKLVPGEPVPSACRSVG